MSSKSKIKGRNFENAIRDKHLAVGVPCERVPGSGLFGGKLTGDICIPSIDNVEFRGECKKRANGQGFAVLEKWMGDDDIMFLARDRQDPMVVLSWDTYIKLMRKYFE